jgi:hypothetical protein
MTNKRLAQIAVTTGAGTLAYTCPIGYRTKLVDLLIANTIASTIGFSLYIVPLDGSPSSSNLVFPNVTVSGNTVIHWQGSQEMNSGDFIQVIGSLSGITITLSGDESRAGI